jgi:hypothetical protein
MSQEFLDYLGGNKSAGIFGGEDLIIKMNVPVLCLQPFPIHFCPSDDFHSNSQFDADGHQSRESSHCTNSSIKTATASLPTNGADLNGQIL